MEQGPKKKMKVKAWHIIFLIIAVLATFGLAYWQWTRFRSGSGTFQNLGYAFQWPLFGLFFVYAYRMILKYENEEDDPEENPGDEPRPMTEIDEDFLPQRPTMDVDTFNRLNTPTRGHHD